jgi:3-oxoacyl-[acyl-carrier protein] reductase
MSRLANKVALVTGGSRGLGSVIVRQLALEGADVALTYVKDETAARAVAQEVEVIGRRALVERADVADFTRAQAVVDRVRAELGGLHVLVCNAGTARSRAIAKLTEDDWDSVMDVTLKGAFNYLRAAVAGFMAQGAGKVVFVGSINGLRGRVGSASYNVAKAGLLGLTKSAAAELGRFNVNVNLVAPGFIEVPSQAGTPELIRDLVLKECAIKRLGTPADIAPVVAFLCTEDARHVTGQIIKVDAGQYL